MSSNSSSYGDEDIGSDEDPTIKVKDSNIQTLNNVMVSHEKENYIKGRESSLSPVKQFNSDSEEEDSEEVSGYRSEKYDNRSESGDKGSSSGSSEEDGFFSDESEGQGEIYEVDGPVQLVKVNNDLSSFEV